MWSPTLSYDSTNSSYWQGELFSPDTTVNAVAASQLRGSIFTVAFQRAVAPGFREDKAIVSFHLAVRPGVQGLYSHLDAADAQVVEDAFATDFFTAKYAAEMTSQWSLSEYAWRNFGADFPLDKNGVSKPGPIWRIRQINAAGTASNTRLPDQDAMTVTYRTGSREHWGRNYFGGLTVGALGSTTYGHWAGTTVDNVAKYTRDWAENLWNNPRVIELVVWSAKHRGIMGIDEIVVDDVVDIQRRRRAKGTTYRKVYTS